MAATRKGERWGGALPEGAYRVTAVLVGGGHRRSSAVFGMGYWPDLRIEAFEVPPGTPYSDFVARIRICNRGTWFGPSSSVAFYQSEDLEVVGQSAYPEDLPLLEIPTPELAPGTCATREVALYVVEPFEPGPEPRLYVLGAIVDDAGTVLELVEDDNLRRALLSVGSHPDLVVRSLAAPTAAEAGGVIDVEVQVCNDGTEESPPSQLAVLLSEDGVIAPPPPDDPSAGDAVVGWIPVPALPPRECHTAAEPVAASVPFEGPWRLGAQIDDADVVDELVEWSNLRTGPNRGDRPRARPRRHGALGTALGQRGASPSGRGAGVQSRHRPERADVDPAPPDGRCVARPAGVRLVVGRPGAGPGAGALTVAGHLPRRLAQRVSERRGRRTLDAGRGRRPRRWGARARRVEQRQPRAARGPGRRPGPGGRAPLRTRLHFRRRGAAGRGARLQPGHGAERGGSAGAVPVARGGGTEPLRLPAPYARGAGDGLAGSLRSPAGRVSGRGRRGVDAPPRPRLASCRRERRLDRGRAHRREGGRGRARGVEQRDDRTGGARGGRAGPGDRRDLRAAFRRARRPAHRGLRLASGRRARATSERRRAALVSSSTCRETRS